MRKDGRGIMGELARFTVIKNNPELTGLARWIGGITYSADTGVELKLELLQPWAAGEDKRYPCIVFVQGSAWTFPDVGYELPQLGEFARKGYVVATLTHRSSVENHKAPAFLEDVKTGIRFLRKNAAKYGIDPERIGIWGTSSGGNTALLMGLTGDDPFYRTKEYSEYSDAVKTVAECFGPADLFELFKQGVPELDENGQPSIFIRLLGDTVEEQRERMSMMNPVEKVVPEKQYPPFLLMHGDKDELVPYDQCTLMADKLCECGVHTEVIRVEGAPHEGDFWSQELLDLIEDFFARTL